MLQDWSQERAGRIKKEKKDIAKPEPAPEATASPLSAPPSVQESVITSASALKNADPREMQSTLIVPRDSGEGGASEEGYQGSLLKKDDDLVDDSKSCYSYTSNDSLTQRTAGLLVIGDEILKGSTADTNTQAAAKAFREKSVLLKRVVVVSDDMDDIVNEILTMQHEVGRYQPACAADIDWIWCSLISIL